MASCFRQNSMESQLLRNHLLQDGKIKLIRHHSSQAHTKYLLVYLSSSKRPLTRQYLYNGHFCFYRLLSIYISSMYQQKRHFHTRITHAGINVEKFYWEIWKPAPYFIWGGNYRVTSFQTLALSQVLMLKNECYLSLLLSIWVLQTLMMNKQIQFSSNLTGDISSSFSAWHTKQILQDQPWISPRQPDPCKTSHTHKLTNRSSEQIFCRFPLTERKTSFLGCFISNANALLNRAKDCSKVVLLA